MNCLIYFGDWEILVSFSPREEEAETERESKKVSKKKKKKERKRKKKACGVCSFRSIPAYRISEKKKET